jgi:peptidoglycan/LPS O-acetylase OafA/YrhL
VKRLLWLDISKALAICWVVYFHFYSTYFEHGSLPPDNWSSLAAATLTMLRMAWHKVSEIGFHAVGVFIILSGWALMQSTANRAASGPMRWGNWYRARFLRLYPMYWVSHLVYLVSPFVARLEPVDSRIILSLLGLRFINITMNFMYLNAAWWYFSMLIQFYLIFPLLFRMAQRLGPLTFLLVACAVGFFTRYLLLIVYPQNGLWILGGFAISRLPEFALGMACGIWHSRSTDYYSIPQRYGFIITVTPTSLSTSRRAAAASSRLSGSPESFRCFPARPGYSPSLELFRMASISFISPTSFGSDSVSVINRSGCFS